MRVYFYIFCDDQFIGYIFIYFDKNILVNMKNIVGIQKIRNKGIFVLKYYFSSKF